jgi:tripartite-type tricarboxylate transporter receptor subunit TctC
MLRRSVLLFALSFALCMPLCGARAETYPSRPITLIVPFAPGGTTDIVAKTIAERLGKELGHKVDIVNKSGRGGTFGMHELVKAAPDGYTLGMASASTTATNPALNQNHPYDPQIDLVPIINVAATPNLLAVHPAFPARDFPQFIATLRDKPGMYAYASTGVGGIAHLQMELLKSMTRIELQHISYRGAGPALNDVVAGQVPIIYDNVPSALPFVNDGRLIPIAVAAPQRLKNLPNIPTFKELGLEEANRMGYYGIVAPKGLSADKAEVLNAAVNAVLKDPEVRKKLTSLGAVVIGGTSQSFVEQIRVELGIYKSVVKSQNLRIE